ncbi:TPA: uracil-xanthine permease family protein [Legionella pneumophila]
MKPTDIIYGVDEPVPLGTWFFLGLQQLFVCTIYLILTSIIVHHANGSDEIARDVISRSLIMMGIAAIMQSLWKGPVGSGFLAPACVAVMYFSASLKAVNLGGLPLLFGMLIVAGIIQMLFAFFIKRMRILFPPVITGLLYCAMGLDIGLSALKKLIDDPNNLSINMNLDLQMFSITLFLIIGFSVWGKGLARLLCTILGLTIGVILAYFLGVFSTKGLEQIANASWFYFPSLKAMGFAFDWTLLPAFTIAAIAAGLRTMGVITTCQQINDNNWKRPDYQSIKKGVFTDGLNVALSGLVGTAGVGVSPSAVGVSKASGATSRYIAFSFGLSCFIFAMIPKFASIFVSIPISVAVAGLVFTSCILLVGGIRIIASREIEIRRTFIIGLTLLLTISQFVFVQFFEQLPSYLKPITSSGLALAALMAISLNLLFQIKKRRSYALEIESGKEISQILDKIRKWNISQETFSLVDKTITTLTSMIINQKKNDGKLKLTLDYNEIDLWVKISYCGELPDLPRTISLTSDNIIDEQVFFIGLSAILKELYPDKINVQNKNGQCELDVCFFVE